MSVALYKPGLDNQLLSSLEGFVNSLPISLLCLRGERTMLSTEQCYQDEGTRIVLSKYLDGKSDNTLRGRKKVIVETYNVVLGSMDSSLRVRKAAHAELCERFGFLK